jgi:hypothetical protein
MGLWTTASHWLQQAWAIIARGFVETATFLESDDPVAKLSKDFLVAAVIAIVSSGLVSWLLGIREQKKIADDSVAIRELILESIAGAHAQIRGAIERFNYRDYSKTTTRVKHLAEALLGIRNTLSASVVSGFGFLSRKERAVIANYLGTLSWKNILSTADAQLWVDRMNGRLRDVMRECGAGDLQPWINEDVADMKGALQRLDNLTPEELSKRAASAPTGETLREILPLPSDAA